MSKLKKRLAIKLSALFDREVKEEDIDFCHGGNRMDVVRFTVFGCDCFSSASHAVLKTSKMTLCDLDSNYHRKEIYIEPPC